MTDQGPAGALSAARTAYAARDWARAHECFTAARARAELDLDDLSALADAAWWLGRTDECLDLSEQVYRQHLHGARVPAAAELALSIGFLSLLRGEATVGSGWISRARRLLRDEPTSRAHAILLSFATGDALASGDFDAALATAGQVLAIGHQLADPDATAIGLVSEGVALVRQGRVRDGMAVIDEAMLPVRAGQVTPDWTGNLYCQVMQLCHELADVRRAREWTEITERWCEGFPSAVMFTGICRVHRVQLRRFEGDWSRAEQEALRVCDELATMNVAVVGEAHYQLGEIRRQRGDLPGAEQAYQRAHEHGRDPQPGLAMLRLAQDSPAAATALIATAVAATADPLARAPLRAAQVEICHAAGEADTALAAADDLDRITATYATAGLTAAATQARGVALLAAGRAVDALPLLREACRRWRDLAAPHAVARTRLWLAEAYLALADTDAATLELDAATQAFDALGAAADLQATLRLRAGRQLPAGLTAREAEVLAQVAAGASNRDIATALFISEKTVARHLSNIFTKIDVSSRTEAAAYAYRHGLAARG